MLAPMSVPNYNVQSTIPARAGVGFRPDHARDIFADRRGVEFFLIRMVDGLSQGGQPHRSLCALRDRFPLSLHGTGLSLGGPKPLDREHLARLQKLVAVVRPGQVSDHLVWSSPDGASRHHLLPVPYDEVTLERVCSHIGQVQNALGVRILLQNPCAYAWFESGTMTEIEFLSEIVSRTDCRLLLDLNNVQVSAIYRRFDPNDYVEAFPAAYVGEIHLAGLSGNQEETGYAGLADALGGPETRSVWALYDRALARTGPVPTVVDWDGGVPPFPALAAQAARANAARDRACGLRLRQAA